MSQELLALPERENCMVWKHLPERLGLGVVAPGLVLADLY